MRRILSLIVALGLAGLGSLPASACALTHSQPGDCVTPQTKTDCERTGMGHAEKRPLTASAASKTCCVVSEAPAPEAKTWAGSFAVAAAPAFASIVVVANRPIESAWSPEIEQDSSPPPLQSLLCTFLI